MAETHLNVFNQVDSRYIMLEKDLKDYLHEMYAGRVDDNFDFRVRVCCPGWHGMATSTRRN